MQNLTINDNGTWRIPTRGIHVNDNTTWRQIKMVYVNDGGSWRIVHNVSVEDKTCTTSASVAHSAGLIIPSNISNPIPDYSLLTHYVYDGVTTTGLNQQHWYHPAEFASGAGFKVRFTNVSGSDAQVFGPGPYTLGSWISLDVVGNPAYVTYTISGTGHLIHVLGVDISPDGGTTVLSHSRHTFDMTMT